MKLRPFSTFVRWFLLALSYAVGAFFAYRYGLPQEVWRGDVTHMTTAIAAVFVSSIFYIGYATWRYESTSQPHYLDHTHDRPRDGKLEADAGIGRMAAFTVTLLGLLGTTIGLMLQVRAMGSIDVSNPQNVVQFIATIGEALSTALYATACGIIASIGIAVMTAVLEYDLDRKGT